MGLQGFSSNSGSCRNLTALIEDDYAGGVDLSAGGPLSFSTVRGRTSRASLDSAEARKGSR